jgi:chondroitin sulfate synthase
MVARLRSFYELSRWHLTMFSNKISRSFFLNEPTTLKSAVEKQSTRSVTLIVPLYGRLDNFKRFVGVYKNLIKTDKELKVIVALSGSETERFALMDVAQEALLPNDLSRSNFQVVTCNTPFKKANCLQIAINLLAEKDLFFVYDVDLVIDEGFIKRIRAVAETEVYFPILMSQFEADKENWPSVNESSGYWRTWGVGPVAMTKETYDRSDRYNQTISGWGNEDTELYENFITKKIKFLRSRDAGIFHPWHVKNCEGLPKESGQHGACVKVNLEHKMNLQKLGNTYLTEHSHFLEFLETDQMIVSPPMPINKKKAVLVRITKKTTNNQI